MVTLTADVAVVPVEHLAAFRGPATCTSDPKHINTFIAECKQKKNIVTAVLSAKVNPCGNLGHVCVCVFPTHAKEWFQKTQTGLVLYSVSSSVYSKVMGGSRMGGRGGPSLCTVALTMAVLITGRLGSLERQNPRLGMT